MAQFIDRTSLFMTLVGLTSLLVGGIGVANGTRAWLEARARSIATLRCLGASGAAGVRGGADPGDGAVLAGHPRRRRGGRRAAAAGLRRFLANLLPVPPVTGIFPGPLALAAIYGLLTAATFALWPLARAMRIPGAALFRDPMLPARVKLRGVMLAANLLLAAALVGLTVATADGALVRAVVLRRRDR